MVSVNCLQIDSPSFCLNETYKGKIFKIIAEKIFKFDSYRMNLGNISLDISPENAIQKVIRKSFPTNVASFARF